MSHFCQVPRSVWEFKGFSVCLYKNFCQTHVECSFLLQFCMLEMYGLVAYISVCLKDLRLSLNSTLLYYTSVLLMIVY